MFQIASALSAPRRLALPYFRSEDRWKGGTLLGAFVALQLGQVGLSVALNEWNNAFYNALQERGWSTFAHQLAMFAGLASAAISVRSTSSTSRNGFRSDWVIPG